MKKIVIRLLTISLLVVGLVFALNKHLLTGINPNNNQKVSNDFSFIFMTDLHIQPENNAVAGVKQAIKMVNDYKPDFVMLGGDLIIDAWSQQYSRADSLYNLFQKIIREIQSPVHYTIGNHDIWGFSKEKGVDVNNPEYGKKMFEKRIGKRYYNFTYKNYRFYVLDGIDDTNDNQLKGHVSDEQLNWLKNDLAKVSKDVPLAIVCHIPFVTTLTQLQQGALAASPVYLVIDNNVEVLKLFDGYNLKLVLQGHLHFFEDLYVNNIHFVTGGSICGDKWHGPDNGTNNGFVVVNIVDNNPTVRYVEDKWESK